MTVNKKMTGPVANDDENHKEAQRVSASLWHTLLFIPGKVYLHAQAKIKRRFVDTFYAVGTTLSLDVW